MREQFFARAFGIPAGLRPAVVDDADDVDEAAAFDRIMHEMGVGPEPQLHVRSTEFLLQRVRRREWAPARRCAGKTPAPDVRSRARTSDHSPFADQRDAVFVRGNGARRAGTPRLRPLAGKMKSSILGAEAKHDVGIGAHRVEQRRLQVAAMDRPIGRAVARLDSGRRAGCGRVAHRSRS